MSGGQRIDDHSFWAGKGDKDTVFPKGVHVKNTSSAEGACKISSYEDTSAKIREQQEMGIKKAEKHAARPLHRN